ncbi:MAG: UDP-N-acetylmuramoyl-L-alanyl-D-glutamate--2,6-diaminopimelate ligase, partial [bacterium]|nr:UDP-N-acetylmuramoyl-L-alanyl-D-glutamate--2,6-diaminopimelate ligase [bacterium]
PLAIELHKTLKWMKSLGAKYITMEVSSHALALNRADDVYFDVGVFLNCTRDHLDFHKTFENYLNAKLRIFDLLERSPKTDKVGVFNYDDNNREILLKKAPNAIKYSIYDKADIYAVDIHADMNGSRFKVVSKNGVYDFSTKLLGYFNVSNIVAAIAALSRFIDIKDMIEGVKNLDYIDGRFMHMNLKGRHVIIDYAHTPEAFSVLFKNIKQFYNGRIITLFGCGGERDVGKRPLMGKIAAENSDYIVLTSDNPRGEDPNLIIKNIEDGIVSSNFRNYVAIVDRKQAIHHALKHAKKGDVVLILGKGHERYQVIGSKKIYFYDPEIVKSLAEKIED